jgi:hypothetical protein
VPKPPMPPTIAAPMESSATAARVEASSSNYARGTGRGRPAASIAT